MDQNPIRTAPEAAADEPASPFNPPSSPFASYPPDPHPEPAPAPAPPPKRIGWFDGHLPDRVDPLNPQEPEDAFTETRRLRHDGWTPVKMQLFLQRLGECGVIVEACEAAKMSARSAYNLRDRDPLFAAGMEAARTMARGPLADEAHSRARNGVIERIYKDGLVVAERHRYDNRLTMSVLARLDARFDRAEERDAPHLRLTERWDDFLTALEEDRRDDGLALLAGAPAQDAAAHSAAAAGCEVQEKRGDHELHELHDPDHDPHIVWDDEDGWWTDYPPPAGFDGEEEGQYGDLRYRRSLSPEEQAVIDGDEADARAVAEAQRAAYFATEPWPDDPQPPTSKAPASKPPAPKPPTSKAPTSKPRTSKPLASKPPEPAPPEPTPDRSKPAEPAPPAQAAPVPAAPPKPLAIGQEPVSLAPGQGENDARI
jgi:hypothetical protein